MVLHKNPQTSKTQLTKALDPIQQGQLDEFFYTSKAYPPFNYKQPVSDNLHNNNGLNLVAGKVIWSNALTKGLYAQALGEKNK